MMSLACDVIQRLQGKTLVTAESLTGGGIGCALTGVPGSSAVYKGGIISYTDQVKHQVLKVPAPVLKTAGAVSGETAEYMARGVRNLLHADYSVAVTGLAGPGGDSFGNPVGTVFIGYSDSRKTFSRQFLFSGDRESIRRQTVTEALKLILTNV